MSYINLYIKFLKKFLRPKRPLKIIFDCSNGIVGLVLKKLLNAKRLTLNTVLLNAKTDGRFPAHGPNPLVRGAMRQVRVGVRRRGADLGVVFDADGDRAFFVDDRGRFLDGDVATALLMEELKPKKTVVDVGTGWLIKRRPASSVQHQVFVSRVGTYFIKEAMRKRGADFGAERSGHYYFSVGKGKNLFYFDSGILAAIQMINRVSKLKGKLSDYLDTFPKYYRESLDFHYGGHRKSDILSKLEKKYKKSANMISKLDGIKVEFNNWWFNIRFSNTEPLLRLNIEVKSEKLLNKKSKEIHKFLAASR